MGRDMVKEHTLHLMETSILIEYLIWKYLIYIIFVWATIVHWGEPHGVGEYKDGKYHGQRTLTLTNGTRYEEGWKDAFVNGQGTLTYPNERGYIGEWKDGNPNGQGTYIFVDGSKGIGEFREGRPWNITHRDKNGNIKYKYVNGKQIKQ